jgi:hypothetical protein
MHARFFLMVQVPPQETRGYVCPHLSSKYVIFTYRIVHYACMCEACMHMGMYKCMSIHMDVYEYVCLYGYMNHACEYICMLECMHAKMCICITSVIHTYIGVCTLASFYTGMHVGILEYMRANV